MPRPLLRIDRPDLSSTQSPRQPGNRSIEQSISKKCSASSPFTLKSTRDNRRGRRPVTLPLLMSAGAAPGMSVGRAPGKLLRASLLARQRGERPAWTWKACDLVASARASTRTEERGWVSIHMGPFITDISVGWDGAHALGRREKLERNPTHEREPGSQKPKPRRRWR